MIALLLLSLAAQEPAPAPAEPFSGKFEVVYQPIYCVRAPCPPGSYRITMPGRPAMLARTIDYDPATPPAARIALRGHGMAEGAGIDGLVRFVRKPGDRAVHAIILARRSVAGRWKP